MKKQFIIFVAVIFSVVLIVGSFWLFAGNTSIPVLQNFQVSNGSNVEHFSNSIDLANQATMIFNSGGAFKQMADKDIKVTVNYYKQALDEARQVDIETLNNDYAGFGDHYRDEFIRGAGLFIEGYEQSDADKFLQGQVLLDQWGSWFSKNINNIRNL